MNDDNSHPADKPFYNPAHVVPVLTVGHLFTKNQVGVKNEGWQFN